MNIEDLWKKTKKNIENSISPTSYDSWIKNLELIGFDDSTSTLTLSTDNMISINIIEKRLLHSMKTSAKEVFEQDINIKIEYRENKRTKNKIKDSNKGDFDILFEENILNPKYTFDNFVVGDNNRHAHAVALSIANSEISEYNPFFLYGGPGLGKTHLMHAIGMTIMKNFPYKKVLYVPAETFTTDLINSIRKSSQEEFKNKYRMVDVLLIDDIQFMQGKESTQEEFFHTFNSLTRLGKQIVISSDRSPNHLNKLDERLRSRFMQNVTTDIKPANFETRVAILQKKCEIENFEVDANLNEVINLIAHNIDDNIRALEGTLTKLISFSRLLNEKITIDYAKKNLPEIFKNKENKISCETIKIIVSNYFNISISDLESKNRKKEFTIPRQIAMFLCRELTGDSLPKIGELFGGKDHSTVLHACRKIKKLEETDNYIKISIEEIKNKLL